jgi:hypothetical protein
MSLKDFLDAIFKYLSRVLSEKFTGKIILTLNIHQGGIGNVQITATHDLQKVENANDNKNKA